MSWKSTEKHWTKSKNAKEIIARINNARSNNESYKAKIQTRMRGPNNPSKNPIYRDKMIASKKKSQLVPRGEKHHNWKGGVTPKHNMLRGSLEYILWRNAVYKRDNWKCRICEMKCMKGNIIAHHLKKFADYPELRFVVDNGITLCRRCHIQIEKPITHT